MDTKDLMSDELFHEAIREGRRAKQEQKAETSEKLRELLAISRLIEDAVVKALTGEFFGKPKRSYHDPSEVRFPHIHFSLEFAVPKNPRLKFAGHVRWIAQTDPVGGAFEDHSKCFLEHAGGNSLGEAGDIDVPSTLTADGTYALDVQQFRTAVASALKRAASRSGNALALKAG